jgi:hypothetical protein
MKGADSHKAVRRRDAPKKQSSRARREIDQLRELLRQALACEENETGWREEAKALLARTV